MFTMTELPNGVCINRLDMHHDDRGVFTEIFRREWCLGIDPVQWNVVRSVAGVLRGVHVHPRHDDYLIVAHGRVSVGLRDLRRGSSTEGLAALVGLSANDLQGVFIPHGVAHGFYFHEPSIHLYAVSHRWDPSDEKACLWSDPALGIPWPVATARVSDRDAGAQPLSRLLDELESEQPI
jgi:dTDP-4-dehydrorhamnose 3,5-epimerase